MHPLVTHPSWPITSPIYPFLISPTSRPLLFPHFSSIPLLYSTHFPFFPSFPLFPHLLLSLISPTSPLLFSHYFPSFLCPNFSLFPLRLLPHFHHYTFLYFLYFPPAVFNLLHLPYFSLFLIGPLPSFLRYPLSSLFWHYVPNFP